MAIKNEWIMPLPIFRRTKKSLHSCKLSSSGLLSCRGKIKMQNGQKIYFNQAINYFDNTTTNALAASFNVKIKAFRAPFRVLRNIEFFLF